MQGLSFSDLVSPLAEADFIDHYCEKRFVHLQQGSRSRLEYLLPWNAVSDLLSQNLLDRKRLRVARDGRDIPPDFYRRDGERDPVDSDKLSALLGQSASLVVNRVQDLHPPVRRLARQIEDKLKQQVNVNGYLTFGSGGAFAMHYDSHDVLVLQIHGNKRWFIYDQEEVFPLLEDKPRGSKPAPRNVATECVLEAGDVLFVPRGVYHRAAAMDVDSVHLTFGVHTIKGIDFIESLRDLAAKDPLFRRDIAVARGPEAVARQEQEIKERYLEIVRQSSILDVVKQSEIRRSPVDLIRLGPSQLLDDATLLAPLVRHRGPHPLKSAPAKDDASVREAAQQSLARLLDENFMRFGELRRALSADIENDTIRAAVAALLKDRLIEIVD
jgi:ribosomal protein L16 Arg81 hydroxylase